jgi:hypothetical protein
VNGCYSELVCMQYFHLLSICQKAVLAFEVYFFQCNFTLSVTANIGVYMRFEVLAVV